MTKDVCAHNIITGIFKIINPRNLLVNVAQLTNTIVKMYWGCGSESTFSQTSAH
jgi:hypothetical protein